MTRCRTRTTGRVINEKCDECEHSLHWHNITYDAERRVAPMPDDGWPCLACEWERRMDALETTLGLTDSEEDDHG